MVDGTDSNISLIDTDELQNSISNLKKLITQIEKTVNQDSVLISIKDANTLEKSQTVLEKLIKKKTAIINKRVAYDKKVAKARQQLFNEIKILSDKEKLSFVLAHNFNAFSLGTHSLKEALDEFLDIAAKEIVKASIKPREYLQRFNKEHINKDNPNYQRYLEIYNQKVQELNL